MVFEVTFLLGAVHGIILAFLLAGKKVNSLSNRILGSLVFVFSTDLAMASFLGFDLQFEYPYLIGLDFPITLLYGPLLFLYTKSLVTQAKSLKPTDWIHFGPFLVMLFYTIPFYLLSGAEKIALVSQSSGLEYGWDWVAHVKVIFNICYLPFVVIMLMRYKRVLKDTQSSFGKRNLDWLQDFVIAGVSLAVVAVIIHLFSTFSTQKDLYADLMLLSVTIFVYGIGYMGLRQPEFFIRVDEDAVDKYQQTGPKSYSKSGLDEATGKEKIETLKTIMKTEKPYLKNDLNLRELADLLEVSTHNLTEIINRKAGRNFYDFVNSYRVDEVKERLQDSDSQNLTLLAIAMESGFNSKSSFNSVFKKHTGLTPSQFRKSLK